MNLFSVLILTHRRPDLLRACLKSICGADLGTVKEIIVAVNGEDPDDAAAARSFGSLTTKLKVVQIEKKSRGGARNAALELAEAAWIYFLDDDVEVPPHLFADAADIIAGNADAWVLGGPNLTPKDSGLFERASGRVLESWIAAGPMRRRYAPGPDQAPADEKSFALCNLCVRKKSFSELELKFDPDLASAEENLFIDQLNALDRPALYAPRLFVYHRRRGALLRFLAQVYESGVGRRQVLKKRPQAAQIVFFFPAALALYAAFLTVARPAWPFWAPPSLYAVLVAAQAAICGRQSKSIRAAFLFLILVPLCHFSYGAGFLIGWRGRKSHGMPASS